MKDTELDHRARDQKQNLLMHMMHAMFVHMICFLSDKLYKDLFANVLKILNFLRHIWNNHIIFGNFLHQRSSTVLVTKYNTRGKENKHPMEP